MQTQRISVLLLSFIISVYVDSQSKYKWERGIARGSLLIWQDFSIWVIKTFWLSISTAASSLSTLAIDYSQTVDYSLTVLGRGPEYISNPSNYKIIDHNYPNFLFSRSHESEWSSKHLFEVANIPFLIWQWLIFFLKIIIIISLYHYKNRLNITKSSAWLERSRIEAANIPYPFWCHQVIKDFNHLLNFLCGLTGDFI